MGFSRGTVEISVSDVVVSMGAVIVAASCINSDILQSKRTSG